MLLNEMNNEAVEHILPFWMKLQDCENGGYYGFVDYEVNLDKEYDKGGIATARILWSFSAAYNAFGDHQYLEHATHAYKFLKSKIIDSEFGGLYWMVDYKGNVTDERKHVYAQSFGIYALCEYYNASKNVEIYHEAMGLFELIESKAYKEINNSYGEEYARNWIAKSNEMLSENGVVASITTNTMLHVLEAYTLLAPIAEAFGNTLVKERLYGLVNIFVKKIWNKDNNHMKVFFDDKWNSLIELDSYGHDIEATWLIDKALKVLDLEQDDFYGDFVSQIGKQVFKEAIAADGSLNYENEKGVIKTEKVWWCQAEAIVGFVNLYEREADEKWMKTAQDLWAYTKQYIIESGENKEWKYSILEDTSSTNRPIVEPWKTPYHNLRACIEIVKRLKKKEGIRL